MSTKTTFKRIALVTVAALGFGTLSTVAQAAPPETTAGTYTASVTPSTTSLTVVGTSTSTYGFIGLTTTNNQGNYAPLYAGESITATVTAWPTGVDSTTAAADLTIAAAKRTSTGPAGTWADDSATSYAGVEGSGSYAWAQSPGATKTDTPTASITTQDTNYVATYWMAIKPAAKAIGAGTYTIRLRLTDSTGFISSQNVSVNFVASAADSGAVITVTSAGTLQVGETLTYRTGHYVKAALRNAAGGLIQTGGALNAGPGAPALSGAIVDKDGAVLQGATGFDLKDTGVAAEDFITGTTDSATAWTSFKNGDYGFVSSATESVTATAATTNLIRVRYGSTSATKAMTIIDSATGNGVAGVTATGAVATSGASTTAAVYSLPLSTTSATVAVYVSSAVSGGGTALANKPVTFYTTWNSQPAGDVTPKSGATYATVVYTDANGYATYTVTHAAPVDGAQAIVTFGGLTTGGTATVNWTKSKPATITVDPVGPALTAALKSSTKMTFTVLDAFSKPVVGAVVKLSNSSSGANYSTAGISSATTDANGQITYTLTDAAAEAEDSDVITATAVDNASATTSLTIDYATTVPAAATATMYYSETETSAVTGWTIAPVTTIGGSGYALTQTKDVTKSLSKASGTSSDDLIGFAPIFKTSANVAASGVAVTVTATAGGWILSSAGLPVTSRTYYTNTDGQITAVVTATTPGTKTFTFTSGTVTKTASVAFKNSTTDARFLSVTTGTDNKVTAKVTDLLGNPVSGVTLSTSVSGGTLAGGAVSAQWTTGSDGSYTALLAAVSADTSVSVSVSASVSGGGDQLSDPAGYVGTAAVTGAGAGISSVTKTVTVVGTAQASDVAQSAADAAAEATDAANAATDAANAAAEAADAATAAAQDAADAVAALSAQVATLISGLKAQLTALTNLVIKIQKKFKA